MTHDEAADLFYDRFHCYLVSGLTLLVDDALTILASDDNGNAFSVTVDDPRLEREPGQFFVPSSVRESEGDGLLRCFEAHGMAKFTGHTVTLTNGAIAEVWSL